MSKVIYDKVDQVIRPYSREDEGEIVGLDTARLAILTVQNDTAPSISAGQRLEPKTTIDLENGLFIHGWEIKDAVLQWPNKQAFMAAFTDAEKAAIGLSRDATVAGMLVTLSTWVSPMHPNDPRVSGGLARLVEVGILTEQRKEEIIATATN